MAVPEDEEQERPVVVVPSAAVELFWALCVADKPERRSAHAPLEQLYGADSALAERVTSFWTDGHVHFDELLVLAERGGVLTGDPPGDELLAAIGRAAERGRIPGLASEREENRARIVRRLEQLAADRRLRLRYRNLLGEVWGPIEQHWRATGLPRVRASARHAARRITAGAEVVELFPASCEPMRQLAAGLIGRRERPVTVAVAMYGGKALVLDLCDSVLLGITAPPAGIEERDRAVELGRRLRAVADPTRLVMLRLLADQPRRVGELASDLGVAQPTVSNHLKLLRDGGFVRAPRRGGELALDPDAVEALIDGMRELLGTNPPG
jgi:DNA-binding transcriptional ArsR family regulator